ncbi:MAG: S1 RNA-binding domain-containing protein, partial [Desulfohalobiaceae bacterium]
MDYLEHVQAQNQGQDAGEETDFETALENYLNTDFGELEEGSIITGKVVKVDRDNVLVDVNFKSEGQIPLEEFRDRDGHLQVQEGDDVDVFVVNKDDVEGVVALSHKRAKRMRILDELEEMQQEEQNVRGTIVQRIKGGYTVEINGIEAFLPGSHVDLRPVPDMDALVGQDFDFRILKINRKRTNVIVSRRVILEEEREKQRQELLANLEEGQTVTGKAKNITEYGVFVDLGGLDGLLHITDMSWKRIRHPKEMVQIGDTLELKVLSYDPQEQKVSLGMKQLVSNPWDNIAQKFPPGERFTGKVTNLV